MHVVLSLILVPHLQQLTYLISVMYICVHYMYMYIYVTYDKKMNPISEFWFACSSNLGLAVLYFFPPTEQTYASCRSLNSSECP